MGAFAAVAVTLALFGGAGDEPPAQLSSVREEREPRRGEAELSGEGFKSLSISARRAEDDGAGGFWALWTRTSRGLLDRSGPDVALRDEGAGAVARQSRKEGKASASLRGDAPGEASRVCP